MEKDRQLAGYIKQKIKKTKSQPSFVPRHLETTAGRENKKLKSQNLEVRLEVIEGDVLKVDLGNILEGNYKIVSNLPYQITSPILWRFLNEEENKPKEMVLMVQKEVADRILAKPGQMNLLAVLCQFYANCELVTKVGRGSFWPVPAVDSAVVKLTLNNKNVEALNQFDEKMFFKIVKAGFANKRKMLKNNLAKFLCCEPGVAENELKQIGLGGKIRAQELLVDNWIELMRRLV